MLWNIMRCTCFIFSLTCNFTALFRVSVIWNIMYFWFISILGLCNLECFVIVKGDVLGSIAKFDKAIELDPRQKACRLQAFFLL